MLLVNKLDRDETWCRLTGRHTDGTGTNTGDVPLSLVKNSLRDTCNCFERELMLRVL
jgi:hypothetical protein